MATRSRRDAFRSGVHRQGRRDVLLTVLLVALLGGLFALYGPLNEGPARWSLKTPLDAHIPLVEEMVIPYVSALALGPLTLLLFLLTSTRTAQSALIASIVLMVVAYLFYVFAQTHVARPEVTGDDLFSRLLRMVYGNDNAYNCFPSLHTGFSVIIAVHWLRHDRRIGGYVAAWCALIIASTLFVHQHYIADMLAGLATASFACWAAARLTARLPALRTAQEADSASAS
ncbi:PAP2 superfamily protein [Thermomonospora echinospora]|uniref:PAP2 superfamily protein n=1 Tax=Thermomonospora echinospora TaxID=1992 RepID=A0A1H5ZCR2_9ACTN|nr:phosphatase PAP2 family protein [Thermomonospora echinospora]SEG34092.1 PAP2 superfamily protein [Thermomonospora echinospora]